MHAGEQQRADALLAELEALREQVTHGVHVPSAPTRSGTGPGAGPGAGAGLAAFEARGASAAVASSSVSATAASTAAASGRAAAARTNLGGVAGLAMSAPRSALLPPNLPRVSASSVPAAHGLDEEYAEADVFASS